MDRCKHACACQNGEHFPSSQEYSILQQQHKLQVCENSWVQRITGAKKVGRRRTNDLSKTLKDVGGSLGVDGGGLTTEENRGGDCRKRDRQQL